MGILSNAAGKALNGGKFGAIAMARVGALACLRPFSKNVQKQDSGWCWKCGSCVHNTVRVCFDPQVLQVFLLMWMRTVVNYQMRYGGTMVDTVRALYAEGGVPRFYAGIWAALLQGPLSRFGDTAANAGTLAALEKTAVPIAMQTVIVLFTRAAPAKPPPPTIYTRQVFGYIVCRRQPFDDARRPRPPPRCGAS